MRYTHEVPPGQRAGSGKQYGGRRLGCGLFDWLSSFATLAKPRGRLYRAALHR